ncbi:hypothetical protein [Nocardiopsis aegyptia]|uniref:Putative membrane-bound spermidine synthase n=1 Tax=Nocardiopsis aegyptia TaxID=220378 RepID=A0A7Z0EIP7_9ACTN|nr:hypothetical protein [Nocardiopsis aegyptia]NYJ32812.1 putative membrane-bound spermidine synthase [Nocardiopsis aegyptia]
MRELEEENTWLRDDLEDVTAFSAGGYARPFHVEILPSGDWGIYKETRHNDPLETHPDHDAALARARQLREEK